MKLVSYPHYVPVHEYERQLDIMLQRLKGFPGVRAVFQVGSISSPGISDIDMFVVFEDGTDCNFNALLGLSRHQRYLFQHAPFAATVSQMEEVGKYTFFHNYRLIWGAQDWNRPERLPDEDIQALKYQTAIEYMLKMYFSMTVERTFGIISVRGLLLLVKALLYDLEFLNISSGAVYEEVKRIIFWRSNWFSENPGSREFLLWHREFFEILGGFLRDRLDEKRLYLPEAVTYRFARNMIIVPSDEFGYTHKGVTLPAIFCGLGKKYFNIQYRFNRFEFHTPLTVNAPCRAVVSRHEFLANIYRHHKERLPNFLLPASSLAIFGGN